MGELAPSPSPRLVRTKQRNAEQEIQQCYAEASRPELKLWWHCEGGVMLNQGFQKAYTGPMPLSVTTVGSWAQRKRHTVDLSWSLQHAFVLRGRRRRAQQVLVIALGPAVEMACNGIMNTRHDLETHI